MCYSTPSEHPSLALSTGAKSRRFLQLEVACRLAGLCKRLGGVRRNQRAGRTAVWKLMVLRPGILGRQVPGRPDSVHNGSLYRRK
jgi:hypothetical protein